jgi:MGT family glycosyltransferase
MNALGTLEYKVIMSVGKKCDINLLGEIPDNFIVYNFVPQLEILKRTNIFISHGGFNSVSEALYYGVPVIAIPMVNDQYMTARRLVEIGSGMVLKMDELMEADIKDAVSIISADRKYNDVCEKIRKSFIIAGGYQKAVDYILEFSKR